MLAAQVDSILPSAVAPRERPTFRALYDAHAAFVWRTLRRLGVPPAHLEDACQEVFVVVHKKLSGFDGAAPKSWLFAIAMRMAADYRKRAHVRRERSVAEVPEAMIPPPQHAELERRRTRDLLQSVLDDLDEDKRAVFLLYELEGMPMPEIAKTLGCALQTAYSRLHSAREKVKSALSREEARS